MTTVNGDIRTGGLIPTEILGATVSGDIYSGGLLTEISFATVGDIYTPGAVTYDFLSTIGTIYPDVDGVPVDTQPFETVNLPAPLPFNSSISVADPYVPDYGELILTAGNHYFDSLTLGDNVTMKLPINGAVVIHVDGDMTVGSDFEMVFVDDFGVVLDLDAPDVDPADFAAAADEVYIQIDGLPVFGGLSVGDNATWFGTVYAPDGDLFFGSGLDLKGALYSGGSMSFFNNTTVLYEELDFDAVGINLGGGGGGTTVFTDSDSAHYVGVLPSIDISRYGQKAEALVMQYTGDNVVDHSQDPCKVAVTGDPQDASPVRIVTSSRADIDDPKAEIYFDGEVNLGETFAIDALFAGKSKLKGETYVQIFATTGELLGTAKFHTSMSQPLVLGDQFGAIRLVGFIGDDGARAGIVPVEMLTGLSGFVFEDFNDDGMVDLDEYAISGATVTLTGVDDNGIEINRVELTDSDGAYYFDAMRPGTYTITEAQPVGYTDGMDSVGTAGGTLGADSVSEINLEAYVEGVNYNFAEHRAVAVGDEIALGQTATIGFWAGKKGKKLIESLNGSKDSTALGDWLATEFPNIYGKLAGKTNKAVASFYGKLFKATKKRHRHGHHQQNSLRDLDAQVMATALAIYVTDSDLAGNTAEAYGFLVTADGVGAAMFSVGDSGAAFGLGIGYSRMMSIWDILHATNDQAVDGRLYDMDAMLQELADKVYTMINEIGGID